MLKPKRSKDRFYYSIATNPVSRVMKFQKVEEYFQTLSEGNSVVDFGSGDRPYETMLLQKFENYLAADYSVSNEAHARRPDIYIEDYHLDVDSGSVDCVLLTEVLEHIYEPKKALHEIHRILSRGGHVVGSVPFAIGEHEQPHDFHRYTSFCLKQMFEDCDFEVINLEYVGDLVGVATLLNSHVFGIMKKIGHRLKISWLTNLLHQVFRVPEYGYYFLNRLGLAPGKIRYFRNYPFGFSFLLKKKQAADRSDS